MNILNLLYSFISRISKSKITVLIQTFQKILEFTEKNYRFEKDGEILNTINKSILINYSSLSCSQQLYTINQLFFTKHVLHRVREHLY